MRYKYVIRLNLIYIEFMWKRSANGSKFIRLKL